MNLAAGTKNSLDPFGLYAKYLSYKDFETLSGYVVKKNARLRRRDELILRVAYETGCRGAEIVDPDNFSIPRIRSELKKAESSQRNEFLYAIIGKGRGSGKVRKIAFPTALAKDILRYANTPNLDMWIRHSRTRTFHGLRHTYATNLANRLRALNENYEQLRERLGHESLDTTNIYINFEILLHGNAEEQNAKMVDQTSDASQVRYVTEEFE